MVPAPALTPTVPSAAPVYLPSEISTPDFPVGNDADYRADRLQSSTGVAITPAAPPPPPPPAAAPNGKGKKKEVAIMSTPTPSRTFQGQPAAGPSHAPRTPRHRTNSFDSWTPSENAEANRIMEKFERIALQGKSRTNVAPQASSGLRSWEDMDVVGDETE
ncbi:hypothetical protein FRB90_003836 [Tulasnella sp. 427]|nr:hypothetical protein FRB90_003836 [Tulasnella sp. 427]